MIVKQVSSVEYTELTRARNGQTRASIVLYAAVVLTTCLWMWLVLGLRDAQWHIPITYAPSDPFSTAVMVRSALDHGSVLENPRLGAPFRLEFHDYPMADRAHMMAMRIIGLFRRDFGFVMNLYFLLGFPLTAIAAVHALRSIGVGRVPAFTAGILYAFLPYHFYRGQAHLFLSSYYHVPLVCLVAIHIAAKVQRAPWSMPRKVLLGAAAICLFTGFASIYYSFFAVFALAVAGCIGAVRTRDWRPAIAATACILPICIAVGIQLLPSYQYAREHGPNNSTNRPLSEVQILGLKLSQMMLPVPGHRIPAMAELRRSYSRGTGAVAPDNFIQTLGVVCSVGLVLSFGYVVAAGFLRRPEEITYATAALALAVFLFGVTDGFGLLFGFLVSTKIRDYSRLVPFLSFFFFAVLAIVASRGTERAHVPGYIAKCLAILILVLGLLDQNPSFASAYPSMRQEFESDRAFVARIEAELPAGAMIFQLPYVPYPESDPLFTLLDYSLFRQYLNSHHLRWSYGAIKGRVGDAWARAMSKQSVSDMVPRLKAAGFHGITIDRRGFADRAQSLESQLAAETGSEPFVSADGNLVYFRVASSSSFSSNQAPAELFDLFLDWREGFSGLQGVNRWCSDKNTLKIFNPKQHAVRVTMRTKFFTGYPEPAAISIQGAGIDNSIMASSTGASYSTETTVPPGYSEVTISTSARRIEAPGDPRRLFFYIHDFHFERDGKRLELLEANR